MAKVEEYKKTNTTLAVSEINKGLTVTEKLRTKLQGQVPVDTDILASLNWISLSLTKAKQALGK